MSIPSSPTPPDDVVFVCACEDWMRSACCREVFTKEHDGKLYCVLHYPGTEKKEVFQEALQRKLEAKNFDFRGVWFPDDVTFENLTFSADANFRGAQFSKNVRFNGAQFSAQADFNGAQFKTAANFYGAQFSADADFSGAQFSADAYFNGAQISGHADFISAQFCAHANFYGAQFKAVANFKAAQFKAVVNINAAQFGAEASFNNARFFAEARFVGAQFSAKVSFVNAQFNEKAHFDYAQFNEQADFQEVQFSATTDFNHSQFNKSAIFERAVFNATVSFRTTIFDEASNPQASSAISNDKTLSGGPAVKAKDEVISVDFSEANFKDGISFQETRFGDRVFMSFAAATFENPERVTFLLVPVEPHWFINVDSRKFTFINVNWGLIGNRDAILKEAKALTRAGKGGLQLLLDITFRQLAVNAEENNRYEEAADFRYMAMDVRRLNRGRKIDPFRLSWWYWVLSGYGERVQHAFNALLVIWLLFTVIYWMGNATWWQQPKQSVGSEVEMSTRKQAPNAVKDAPQAVALAAVPLTLPEAVIYSAGVLSLQKPEPLPANKRAKAFVLAETILGPLQAALLALAIRRKFMR